jgi:leucyl aminopeptidase
MAPKNSSIDIAVETSSPEKFRTGILVVGAFADGTLPSHTKRVDEAAQGKLSAVLKRGDLDEKAGATLLLHDLPGIQAERVLVVSLGKREQFGEKAFRDAFIGAAKALADGVARDAAVTLADIELPRRSRAWHIRHASRLLADGAYRFNAPRAQTNNKKKERGARKVTLLTSEKINDEIKTALQHGEAIAEGIALAKDLGNLPGNVCNPPYLAEVARALAKSTSWRWRCSSASRCASSAWVRRSRWDRDQASRASSL